MEKGYKQQVVELVIFRIFNVTFHLPSVSRRLIAPALLFSRVGDTVLKSVKSVRSHLFVGRTKNFHLREISNSNQTVQKGSPQRTIAFVFGTG